MVFYGELENLTPRLAVSSVRMHCEGQIPGVLRKLFNKYFIAYYVSGTVLSGFQYIKSLTPHSSLLREGR